MRELILTNLSPTSATIRDNGIVLSPSGSGWDSGQVHSASVVYFDGKYRLIYDAQTGSNDWQIGVATKEARP